MAFQGTTGSAPTSALAVAVGGATATPELAGNFVQVVRLKWRVLHPVTGAVIIDPLPHLHQSKFKIAYTQPGQPFDTAIGDFEIPLIPPDDEQHYAWAKPYYDKLDFFQRVEAYLIEEDVPGAMGDPVFTGIILKLPQGFADFKIQGKDSLYLLDMAHTHRAEVFQGRSDQLVTYALRAYRKTYGDDFTGTLTAYTNDGGWTQTTDDTLKSIKSGKTGDGLLLTTASFTNDKYSDCEISAPAHFVLDGSLTSTNQAVLGLLAAVADSNNFVMGQLQVFSLNATSYAVSLNIWQKVAGSYNLRATVNSQLSTPFSDYRPFLQLFGKQVALGQYQWRLMVDGVDLNCVWTQSTPSGSPSGGIGLRSNNGTLYVTGGLSGFGFFSKTNIFQPGNIGLGNFVLNQPIPLAKLSDLIDLALTQESWGVLKHPKAGVNNDQIDFNASPAGDLSAMVRFEEGDEILDMTQEPQADLPTTGLYLSGSPGASGQSILKWYALTAMDTYGLVETNISVTTAIDSSALRQHANVLLGNTSSPKNKTAKRISIKRKKKHNSPATPTGLRWREGHYVTLHIPRQGIFNRKIQIMGFEMVEGEESMELLADTYPQHLHVLPALKRLEREFRALQQRDDEVSAKVLDGSGVIADRRLVVPINPFKAQVQNNATQVVGSSTFTKVSLQVANYDPNNNFDLTNFRYIAPISGYYAIDAVVSINAANAGRYLTTIYKNGVEMAVSRASVWVSAAGIVNLACESAIVALNPSDYVELFSWQNSGFNQTIQSNGLDQAVLTVSFVSQ